MKKVFIDGSVGTTGLRIRERLLSRDDLEVTVLPDELRKDLSARQDAIEQADVAFLCLPDAAAVEIADLVKNTKTIIIDTSTAHRTSDGWAYGFPELAGFRQAIASSKRIANPGCHATGFIALVRPLVEMGLLCRDIKLSAFSLTGYSGGGKKMIADYAEKSYIDGRQYALGQTHKHLPEMVKVCGLDFAPVFSPVVVPSYSGMEVTVALHNVNIDDVKRIYQEYYSGDGLVRFVEDAPEDGFLSSGALSGRDDLEVSVFGNSERVILVSRFDNLGKGASGAAIQNMNIALGVDEKKGLVVNG